MKNRRKQPRDFEPADNKFGHTLLLAGCLLVIIFTCLWALTEALFQAVEKLP
jgi:hypothetical protein